jgi:hypothetical protein
MPLTIIVLQKLWEWFEGEKVKEGKSETGVGKSADFFTFTHFNYLPFLVGLLAGMLPLVHLHSLAVLFVVTVFLFALDAEKWRTWLTFGAGVAIVAIPELLWSITGTATRTSEFFEWFFGWDKGEANFVWFWFENTGLVIPLIAIGIYLFLKGRANDKSANKLWLFYLPFLFLFIISNVAKLAPWQWDNIKVLIYWFVGSLPFIAYSLSWLWQRRSYFAVISAACFLSVTLSGALDVWRTASGQIKTRVFDPDAVRIAEQIRSKTPANALFLNAATYNTAIALTGRESLMRYPGHLSSHGIDFSGREIDVKKMYAGGAAADQLLAKYNVDYVLVSQEETSSMSVNNDYFNKFPVVAEAGNAKVYKVR